MKNALKKIYLVLMVAAVLSGCSTENDLPVPSVGSDPVYFEIEFATRADGDEGDGGEGETETPENPGIPTTPAPDYPSLTEYFVDGTSVILISQRGDRMSLDFNDEVPSQTDPSILVPNRNLYKYVYYTNPDANWDQGYNFQPYGNNALDWVYMESERLNGEYALGALYYPGGVTVYNEVQEDQSIYNNLLKSNILGAWHRTNLFHDRIRFRFYHLMSAIRVTLLIPAWDSTDNTGFGEDAAQSAQLLKIKKAFNIDFPVASTEEPPTLQVTEAPETYDINMYLDEVSNDVEEINLKDIYYEFPDKIEKIRRVTFTVLLPVQQLTSDGPAMRFWLKSMSDVDISYVWYTRDIEDNSSFKVSKGAVTNMVLYLPRVATNAILVDSYIDPWIEAESEFNVMPDDER